MNRSEIHKDARSRTPGHVLAVIENLFDAASITEVAKHLGVQVVVVPVEHALAACRRETPRLIVLDLALRDAGTLLRDPALTGIPTIGFYPHVDPSLREEALGAGLVQALPRSAFFARLHLLLAPNADPPARLPDRDTG